jgi:hypothetical protein|nr:MAG TPA: hypothetical protein [Caudoviricetes sp.]
MADNFGLKIGVEGEKEFKNSLREINQSFKVLGSEMKLVSSEFDKMTKAFRQFPLEMPSSINPLMLRRRKLAPLKVLFKMPPTALVKMISEPRTGQSNSTMPKLN